MVVPSTAGNRLAPSRVKSKLDVAPSEHSVARYIALFVRFVNISAARRREDAEEKGVEVAR